VGVAWSENSYLGLSWQHTHGSTLLGFVQDDAAYLANQIQAH
jgi:putative flavoprotein involved in K+ transport